LNEPYRRRLAKLQKATASQNLNGVILVPGPNLRYYTGVNSILMERPFLLFIPSNNPPHLVAPVLESGPYRASSLKIRMHAWTDTDGPTRVLQNAVTELNLTAKWGIEGRVPFRFIKLLQKYANAEFDDADPLLQELRQIKDEEESHFLERAASILCKSFFSVPSLIKPGMRESELGSKLAQMIRANGADGPGDMLVQSGASSADPHHIASSRKIRRREAIVIDTECKYSGYFADITRTVMIGNDHKFEDLYEKVLDAQTAAIKEAKPGKTTGAVDYAARQTLRKHQLDKYFIHRTGHGLGLEVHEAPYLVENGTQILLPHMAFTVEPGIYFPNRMGIRIEDNLLTKAEGHTVTTRRLSREYGWWK